MVNPNVSGLRSRFIGDTSTSKTGETARTDAVDEWLRETLSRSTRFSILLTPATAVLFAGILWWKGNANATTLIAWCVVLNLVVGLTYRTFAESTAKSTRGWKARMILGQAMAGIVWGALPILAMPMSLVWRPFAGALMLSVLAACASFAAASRAAYWSFTIPLALMVIPAFLLNGGPTGMAYAGVFAYAVPFAAVLRRISGDGHEQAARLAARNECLIQSLSTEKELLGDANRMLEYRATHDPLTGVLNRSGCLAALNNALAESNSAPTRTALLFLDLDNFKSVNDTLGHDIGDRLLSALSQRVQGALPTSAVLARLGGDELTVVLPKLRDTTEAIDVARTIGRLFEQPFDLAGRQLTTSASIGIAISETGDTSADLLRYADAALYKAKDAGRNRYELFDAELRESLEERVQKELELRAALVDGQIAAFVQPFVCLQTGAVLGGEALARWMHPSGVRTAGSFIETAERANLLGDISLAVLEQIRDAKVRSSPLDESAISVNVAPAAINRVMRQVDARSNQLDGLFLEITENGTIEDLEEARQMLQEARSAGAKILFDDIGVGEAPLALLTELPLDGIKIDCDFVWKLEKSVAARSVVEAIVKVAEGMGLWVVAEGVETESQARLLAKLGVPAAQGYLFSPAVPLPVFEEMIEQRGPFPTPWSTTDTPAASIAGVSATRSPSAR